MKKTHSLSKLSGFKRCAVRNLISRRQETFAVVREQMSGLGPNEGMILIAPFLPTILIGKLRRKGFASQTEIGMDGDWFIWFWRETA